MSTFAFGTQKVSDENPMHIEALKEAIEAGVRLIDTAPYYTDGGAQRAIARVMGFFDEKVRSEIKIISKYRYNQELAQSLKESLNNLQLHSIDCCLLDTPEGFSSEAEKEKISADEATHMMYEKIYNAFVNLEDAVQEGTVGSYGISTEKYNLDYERILRLAQKAAKKVGNNKDSFSTIELPINLLEQEGLKVAHWAKGNNLRLLSSRPLKAKKDGLFYRLAEYKEPNDYYHTLNELLEISDNEQLRLLYNLIEQMDANKHKFGWIGDYELFLYSQILPHIKKAIEKTPEDVLQVLLEYIDRFLQQYKEEVAYECAKMTRITLKEELHECNRPIQECALQFLLDEKEIDYVIVGMKKPSYVQEVMALKK